MKKLSNQSSPLATGVAAFAQEQILQNAHDALTQSSALTPRDWRMPLDNGNPHPGEIVLANEARFNVAYYSEPLTNYIVGWKDGNNIEATLDFVFPPVQVPRRFEYKKADNAEAFYSETDDVRSIGAD